VNTGAAIGDFLGRSRQELLPSLLYHPQLVANQGLAWFQGILSLVMDKDEQK
jgi:hypothetical protein